MSYDIYIADKESSELKFTIGYARRKILEEVFERTTFWFTDLNKFKINDSLPLLLKAKENLNNLTNSDKYTEREVELALSQVNELISYVEKYPEHTWDIEL